MKIRANASLGMVAIAARREAERLRKEHTRWSEASRMRMLSFEERCAMDALYRHYADVVKLASHLERLSSKRGE